MIEWDASVVLIYKIMLNIKPKYREKDLESVKDMIKFLIRREWYERKGGYDRPR